MNPLDTDLPVFFLKAGEMYISETPTLIYTVLGSCLTATMYNPRLQIGGMCHALLAESPGELKCDSGLSSKNWSSRHFVGDEFKYVDTSISCMLNAMQSRGISRSEIDVKIFGGSDMIQIVHPENGKLTVGQQNVKTALDIIRQYGLRLVSNSVEGKIGRKIFYYTHTGEVLMRRVMKTPDFVKKQEAEFRAVMKHT